MPAHLRRMGRPRASPPEAHGEAACQPTMGAHGEAACQPTMGAHGEAACQPPCLLEPLQIDGWTCPVPPRTHPPPPTHPPTHPPASTRCRPGGRAHEAEDARD